MGARIYAQKLASFSEHHFAPNRLLLFVKHLAARIIA
jgi:hypothetical protein